MSDLKILAKETAIYGLSSIVGKFLNWCLVPLYSYVLADASEYGIVTNLYAWTAIVIIILTYGMETGFFRFVNKNPEDEKSTHKVYTTTMTAIATTSTLFILIILLFNQPIANAMGYNSHPEFITILGIVVAIDAFDSIPFSYLRYKNRPMLFAGLKILMILVNIASNIFFLVVCPAIYKSNPEVISWFYSPHYGVGYIIISNLISTAAVTIALIPQIFIGKWTFDKNLLGKMLRYSLPLLLFGIAGIMNQTIDKIIFPLVYPDPEKALSELGIYGACFKIAMVMMMFTYAFRFAYEPYVFAKHGSKDSKESYADAMKYYIITSLLIFLGITFYVDIFQFILSSEYRIGLDIIPIVLITYLIQGIAYNLSLWYKLTDKTYWGAILSFIAFILTLAINILLIPRYSYWACAYASLISYLVMTILSYIFGQKYYPIKYPIKNITVYILLTTLLWAIGTYTPIDNLWIRLRFKTLLLLIFLYYIIKTDLPLSTIPVINKFIKNRH